MNLSRSLLVLLALTSFAGAASMHYQSPMLGAIAADLGVDAGAIGWIPTMTFAGYLAGIFFIVPLGDRIDKRRLVLLQLAALATASLAMAAAPSLAVAATLSFLIGAAACVSQGVIPVLTELTPAAERGRLLGSVLTALFLGILFGRLAGGFVAAQVGWRWMFVGSAAFLMVLLALHYRSLPHSPPKTTLGYTALLRSLAPLLKENAALRRAGITQFLLGIAYGSFWATIALLMMRVHALGPTEAGLIGIPGAMGVLVARPAGRWMDRSGVYPVVTAGIVTVLLAFAALQLGASPGMVGIAGLVAGAALLDAGLRGAMVANQTLVQTFSPESRSRVTTLFISHIWAGNSVGAFLGSSAFKHWGWNALCGLCMLAVAAALALQLSQRRLR
jgi:predicted MFS family arabinose efflux permease